MLRLPAQLEFFGHRFVSACVSGLKVVQQPASLADHHQQPSPRAVILLVLLKVLGEMVDALSQQGYLNVCRPGVAFMQPEFRYSFVLRFHSV